MWTELSISHGLYKGWDLTWHLCGTPRWMARKEGAYLATATKARLLRAIDQLGEVP